MLGIIGGTGLYRLDPFKIVDERHLVTPFGDPSAPVVIAEAGGVKAAFLPRHGVHHEILPSEINFRANVWALKSLVVRNVVSVSATGSLREHLKPGELALVSQYFDHTRGHRAGTFFGDGLVAHVSTAEPASPELAAIVARAAAKASVKVHLDVAYACVEGPRLGTRIESHFLRNAGCDLVGMTNIPEAFLAREAQLGYCTMAIVTDFDCWLDDPSQHAQADKIVELYMKNIDRVKAVLGALLAEPIPAGKPWPCHRALEGAVMSRDENLSAEKRELLRFLRA